MGMKFSSGNRDRFLTWMIWSWALVLMVCGALVPAGALRGEFKMPGEYRFRLNRMTDFPVDASGRELERRQWQEGRLRISPVVTIGESLAFYGQADFFSGYLTGDKANLHHDFALYPWDGEDDYRGSELRQLWMAWTTPVGVLRVGQMTSMWGLGLVANDGEGRFNEFGDALFGDLVQRALFATKPIKLFSDSPLGERLVFGVGYDIVWRDDNADYSKGDRAHQWIMSLYYYDDPGQLFTGVYMAMRTQEDDNRSTLDVTAYDYYLNWKSKPAGSGAVYSAAFEGAYLTGKTDRVITDAAPDEIDVLGYGAVLRGGVAYPDRGLRMSVELGYASGDANAYDDTNYAFKFDPDYEVGIVLFDEMMSSVSAVAPDPLADPSRVAVPQRGINQLPTNGAVTNVFYQSIIICQGPPATADRGLTVKGGALHATAVEDFMDPYLTFKAGGVPTNYRGRPNPSKELGWEFDGGVSYQFGSRVKLNLGAQYGYFMPGAAFQNQRGDNLDPVQKVQGRVSVSW